MPHCNASSFGEEVSTRLQPDFWLDLQRKMDFWDAARGLKREVAHIYPLQVAF